MSGYLLDTELHQPGSGSRRREERGLSELVMYCTGKPLDKREQCSLFPSPFLRGLYLGNTSQGKWKENCGSRCTRTRSTMQVSPWILRIEKFSFSNKLRHCSYPKKTVITLNFNLFFYKIYQLAGGSSNLMATVFLFFFIKEGRPSKPRSTFLKIKDKRLKHVG